MPLPPTSFTRSMFLTVTGALLTVTEGASLKVIPAVYLEKSIPAKSVPVPPSSVSFSGRGCPLERVVAGAEIDRVVTNQGAAVADGDRVVAVAGVEDIGAAEVDEAVVAGPGGEAVIAGAAIEHVGSGGADQRVVAGKAGEADALGAADRLDDVIAGAERHPVVLEVLEAGAVGQRRCRIRRREAQACRRRTPIDDNRIRAGSAVTAVGAAVAEGDDIISVTAPTPYPCRDRR
ncbi:hypothetical protein ABIA13_001535 [Sinorhizobium fredii]